MCHQAKFLKGTWDFVYKDGYEPTQNRTMLDDTTSTQRHMHEHINKDTKTQAKARNHTRWHKVSIASTNEAKHAITQKGVS